MIHVDWGNAEETLLVWRFERRWTVTEYTQAVKKTQQLIQNSPSNVHIVVDMRHSRSWHSIMLLLSHAAARQISPKLKWCVVITVNPIWKQLWKTAQRMYGAVDLPVYFVETVDEAYGFVNDTV